MVLCSAGVGDIRHPTGNPPIPRCDEPTLASTVGSKKGDGTSNDTVPSSEQMDSVDDIPYMIPSRVANR